MTNILPPEVIRTYPLERISAARRQDYAYDLFDRISDGSRSALKEYSAEVALSVFGTQESNFTQCEDSATLPIGYLTATGSQELLTGPRVKGFLKAIRDAEPAKTAIDIGTGSSALLAIATALFHPGCEVKAYEINQHASVSAQKIIELYGFGDIVEVINADVFDVTPTDVDLVVSETFHRALGQEQGALLLGRYATHARTLLPAKAVMSATVGHGGKVESAFRLIDIVDFRDAKHHVEGILPVPPDSFGYQVHGRSSLLTEQGVVIVGPDDDEITKPGFLGNFDPKFKSISKPKYVSFSYEHSAGMPSDTFEASVLTAEQLTK